MAPAAGILSRSAGVISDIERPMSVRVKDS